MRVFHHIELHLDKMKEWHIKETQLLLSFVNTRKAVSALTVTRWITEVLWISVTGTTIFKGHSTWPR